MPEQIENIMVIDELWQWKEDPDYFRPDKRRMRREMWKIVETEEEIENEYII
ncbi:MAG TPA: hypothetical protein H9955_02630 [Candidatus Mediterraneibacter cottocaccae]|nr:hypothetical protein [Candidatus Mediterraneibacter cottocaccae]